MDGGFCNDYTTYRSETGEAYKLNVVVLKESVESLIIDVHSWSIKWYSLLLISLSALFCLFLHF